jgi:germination protein M
MKLNRKLLVYAAALVLLVAAYKVFKSIFFHSRISLINEGKQKRRLKVFYVNEEGALAPEEREIMSGATILDDIKTSIAEMSKEPKDPALTSAMPPGTELRSVFVDEKGCVYLDFNRNFSERHPGGTEGELNTIRSIIKTVADNFHDIRTLKFMAEGNELETIAGHIDVSGKLKVK